jgi:DNA-binding transcriptional regulator YhcF (GntR family)
VGAPSPELDLAVDRGHEVPVGTQLAWKLRGLIAEGRLAPGQRLPSIRELAGAAGVNVNTVRAVYGRLEREALVSTEHGRGTFVADRPAELNARRALRREIAALESELTRRPPPPSLADAPPAAGVPPAAGAAGGGSLLTTEELQAVRDELLGRLGELNAARAAVLARIREVDRATVSEPAAAPAAAEGRADAASDRRRRLSSTPSLAGARVRWLGVRG